MREKNEEKLKSKGSSPFYSLETLQILISIYFRSDKFEAIGVL